MKNIALFLLLSMISICTYAGVEHLLPRPKIAQKNTHRFSIEKISLETSFWKDKLTSLIQEVKGEIDPKATQRIEVVLVDDIPEAKTNKDEAYCLSVTNKLILIQATTTKGVYWAIQTLRQLVVKEKSGYYFEGCRIIDYPAFRLRGFMQDVGRSYISLNELKREIAILSQYKINVFHWHLTENQGWRLESKIFPMLNDSSNYERMPGKFYTLEEAKELTDFCKLHNVLLIPEIDMPGHSRAFQRVFRHSMQSKEGISILKLLMDEVCETFDTPFLHIGTDEVEFTNPQFVPEMVEYLRSKGKKIISWNPGWTYKAGEIDMTQLWSYRGKVQEEIPAIDSKFHYINHFDAFADLVALYNSRILDKPEGSENFAGSIIAVWHDRFIESEYEIILQNNFYPSILALAERTWLGGGIEYFNKNGTNLGEETDSSFLNFVDFERRILWHKEKYFAGFPFAYVKQTNVKWKITDAFPNEGDLQKIFPPEQTIASHYSYNNREYNTKTAIGAAIYLRHVWGKLVPAFYHDPQPNSTAYAYTYVYSKENQKVGLWINFQNYSRSESDLPPPQGKWDFKESRIWINEKEVLPPKWESQHTSRSNEIPLTNENFEVRPPLEVNLHKGWNKVFLKLPVGQFSTTEIRLVKWMFTCVFVTPDGKKEVDLIYSPDKHN